MRFLFMKQYIEFPISAKCVALTTTTCLGNMAYQVDDGKDVLKHRQSLSELLSIDISKFTYVHQHHSDIMMEVTADDIGKGANAFEDGLECDALYARLKGVPLCIFHADCVPIFFINEKEDLVGIIHAGFKGTMKHVAYKAIKYVLEKENLNIQDFKFYIGPFRMKQSFELDENSKREIIEAGFIETIKDNHFDNGLANILDLLNVGADESQIQKTDDDTVSDDRFYSAYQKTPVGRLVSLIYLK